MLALEDEKKGHHKWIHISIEDNASIINKIFFWWTTIIINYGNNHIIEEKDLF